MNGLTFGKRFAGVMLAVVLVSSVASIPFRMNSFDENDSRSAFERFIDGIIGKSLPEAHADKPPNKKFKTDESGSPFQRGLKKGIDDRKGNGKPHPDAEFDDPEITKDENKITIKGKSKIKFDNPGQAGKDKWDDYIVGEGPSNGDGTVLEGNYNDLVITKINEKVLQKAKELENSTGLSSDIHHAFIHDDDGDGETDEDPVDGVDNDGDGETDEDPVGEFEFGFEERVLEIEENYNLTFASEEDAVEAFTIITTSEDPMGAASEFVTAATTNSVTQNVLMGFTIAPPAIDWTIGTKQEVCIDLLFDEFCFTAFEARAGFFLEVGFGLRLPAAVTVTTVDTMVEEQVYATSTTSLEPLDFSREQYSAMGVPGNDKFDGNEFAAFLEFFLGVKVVIVEVTVIDWALDTDIDLAEMCTEFTHDSPELEDVDCGNFVTPFGLDEDGVQREFPVPAVTLPADKTGLKMSFAGATLGIGLKLDPTFGSGLITADWSAGGDATGGGTISYTEAGTDVTFGPITAGDISGSTDNAEILLDDFRFHMTEMKITLSANIDLGGWLSFVPDLPYFELITLDLTDFGLDLSLGQHDGTPGVQKDVFVQHFGIDVEVAPETMDVEPGFFGNYTVTVTNKGNIPDTFDTFAVSGLLPNWNSTFEQGEVSLDPEQSTSFAVGIMPYRHFTTSPGDYPFTVSGASEGAKVYSLVRTDSDSDIVHVIPFFEPHVEITPLLQSIKPGNTASYTILVQNFGNVDDSITLAITYPDFGTTYRAVPTAIQPSWTTLGDSLFGPLGPGENDTTTFTVSVPGTWEGMENATYTFIGTTTSQTDPTATASQAADTKVIATKESMARYIDLEILSLISDVSSSSTKPETKTSLLSQLNGAEEKKLQALGYILENKFNLANNMLGATDGKVSKSVQHMEAQKGKGIPAPLADDWIARGNQIIADIHTAIAHPF